MLTTTEAAAALGLTRRRVIALIKAGKLKAEKPGRDWLVDAASVEELKKQERPGGRPRKLTKVNDLNVAANVAGPAAEDTDTAS